MGSLMSLVSHGDVRYEGVLYSIDMPNSSIAMSNGESPLARPPDARGSAGALGQHTGGGGGGEEARS